MMIGKFPNIGIRRRTTSVNSPLLHYTIIIINTLWFWPLPYSKPSALWVYSCSKRKLCKKPMCQSRLIEEGPRWQRKDWSLVDRIKEPEPGGFRADLSWQPAQSSESVLFFRLDYYWQPTLPSEKCTFIFNKASLLTIAGRLPSILCCRMPRTEDWEFQDSPELVTRGWISKLHYHLTARTTL